MRLVLHQGALHWGLTIHSVNSVSACVNFFGILIRTIFLTSYCCFVYCLQMISDVQLHGCNVILCVS